MCQLLFWRKPGKFLLREVSLIARTIRAKKSCFVFKTFRVQFKFFIFIVARISKISRMRSKESDLLVWPLRQTKKWKIEETSSAELTHL